MHFRLKTKTKTKSKIAAKINTAYKRPAGLMLIYHWSDAAL